VLTAFGYAVSALVRTRGAREYAGQEVSDALRKELGLIADIEDVHLDPQRLEVVARGIKLTHPEHGPLALAAELRVRPSWRALLMLQLDLHAITLTQPEITLKIRDGKLLNGPELPPSDDTSDAPAELPFNLLRIDQGRVSADAGELGSAELRRIDLQVRRGTNEVIDIQLEVGSGTVAHAKGKERIVAIEAFGSLSKRRAVVEHARIETPHARVTLRRADLTFPIGEQFSGDVTVDLHLPQLLQWPLPVELPDMRGDVSIAGRLQRFPFGFGGKVDVTLRNVGIDQFGFGERIALKVELEPKVARFSGKAEAIKSGGSLDLSGEIGISESLPIKVKGHANSVSFAKLMEQLGVSENAIVNWDIDGDFSLAGTCNPLKITGPMRMPTSNFRVLKHAWHAPGEERQIMGVERALLEGTVLIVPAGLSFLNTDITMPSSRLRADVLLGFDNKIRVSAQGLDLKLSDASPLVDLALDGRGTFSLEVGGTFSVPTLAGQAAFRGFSLHGFQFGDLITDFELDQDLMGVHFGRIGAQKNDSRYAITGGYMDFREDAFRAGGKMEAERMTLSDFYEIFRYHEDERWIPYQGEVSGEVLLAYSLGRPTDSPVGTLDIDLDLAVPSADLDGYKFRDGHFTGRFEWLDPDAGSDGGKLSIERLVLHKGAGTLNVSGRMDLEGKLDMLVAMDRLSLRDIEPIALRSRDISGTLGVSASVKGIASKPRVDFDVQLTGLALRGEPLGDGRAYVRLTDQNDPWIAEALTWDEGKPPPDAPCGHGREGFARAVWPEDPPLRTTEGLVPASEQPMAYVLCGEGVGGQVKLDVALGRTSTMPIRGRVELDELDLARMLPRARGRQPLYGSVSAELLLTGGAMQEPLGLEGRLAINEARVGQQGVELQNDGSIEISFGQERFAVHRAALKGPGSELRIAGGGSAREGLQLRFDGGVDLGLLTSVSQTVTQAAGSVSLGFSVTGKLEQPAILGEATVRGASLQIASFPEAIRNLNSRLTFSSRRIVLDQLSAQVAGGTIKGSGDATLDGAKIGSVALEIDAEGLAFKPRDGVSMKLGGDTTLTWKKGDRLPLLAGVLRLDEFIYTRNIKMDRTIEDMTAAQRTEVASYDPEDDSIGLDLRIEHSRPLYIRNNLIEAELRLETDKLPFRLVGTDQRFGVIGHVSVQKGTLRFRDQAFEIRQGDITFDDETSIDPSFDLRAATEVRRTNDQTSWQVQIHAFGRRDEFRFELSSDPYLTEDDIALLLTLGMTHSELAQVEAGDLGSTAALEALATVSGVEREVQKALPQIDDFHIASAYSEQSNRTEPQLFVGKRIAENLRLNASTGIAESRDFSTGVQLQLNDQTAVEAVYNNQNATSASQIGDVGVDLKWRLEFD
jgi:translocation and assembly module TamB